MPYLADFGLTECGEPGYPPRTVANLRDADCSLWIGSASSTGGRPTVGTAGPPAVPSFSSRPA